MNRRIRHMKDTIVLHHSLTQDGETVSWQAIRDWHVNTNNWDAIGYHFGIEWVKDFGHIDGHFEVMRGRPLYAKAAAVREKNMNSRAIHICFVGNFDLQEPQHEMWMIGLELVADLCDSMGISPERIYGHRDFAPYKSCPGTKFSVDDFREQVKKLLV